ncbi:hypothetical protein PFLA_a2671 [Pseudoalteromonas flavipulchra NCIMB 2033 = ATCC BAA-314]|nr:hypothetical protein [Pseudoalteromonas flavipulchra NCIMB 2033 = ATCC BAA-314]
MSYSQGGKFSNTNLSFAEIVKMFTYYGDIEALGDKPSAN